MLLENVCVQIILAVEEHVALDAFRCRSRLVNYGQVCVEVGLSCCAELTTIDGTHELFMDLLNVLLQVALERCREAAVLAQVGLLLAMHSLYMSVDGAPLRCCELALGT